MDQAALAAQVRAAAFAPRVDTPEALEEAEAARQELLGAVEVDPEKMATAKPQAAARGGAVAEATLPGIGSQLDTGKVRDLALSTPRHDVLLHEKQVCGGCGEQWPCSVEKNRGQYSGIEHAKHNPVEKKPPPKKDEQTVKTGKWQFSLNKEPDKYGGGVRFGITNPSGEGGVMTFGGAGMPGGTDIPYTGLSVKDGTVVVGPTSVSGIFSRTQTDASGRRSVGNISPNPRTVMPNPYGNEEFVRPGVEVSLGETKGVVVEVEDNRALLALNDPIDGSRMVYVGLEQFQEARMNEDVRPEGAARSVATDGATPPSEKIKGYAPGSRVRSEESGEGTVMEFGETASFVSFDSGALSWVDNRKLLSESENADSFACSNCQAVVNESDNYCGHCGSKFETA